MSTGAAGQTDNRGAVSQSPLYGQATQGVLVDRVAVQDDRRVSVVDHALAVSGPGVDVNTLVLGARHGAEDGPIGGPHGDGPIVGGRDVQGPANQPG